MMKMYLLTIFILILLGNFTYGNQDKYRQAELRAKLAQAKTIEEALMLLKGSNKRVGMARLASTSLEEEKEEILRTADEFNRDSLPTIAPRNGGCEPRIICEPVPIDRATSNDMTSFPQCVEVHRCGGCCQEPQFPCVAIEEKPVTFSPLLLISTNDSGQYEVSHPLTLSNHTKCQCKCGKSQAECHGQGKTLDSILCQCIQPRCSPGCLSSSTCSAVPDSDIPRCTCRRRIPGQNANYCPNSNQRPNFMCTRCETLFG